MRIASYRPVRSAIVLAGGEGKHLRRFVHHMMHTDLPKQYAAIIGTRSMLTHTYDRVERLIPDDRVYTVLGQDHLRYNEVQQQIALRTPHTLVFEPMGRGTGPGILLPLLNIQRKNPDSSVAIFPSDHFILQENLFVAYLQEAFETVEQFPSRIVFLGAEPSEPESEYGYILPDSQESDFSSSDKVIKAFAEQPDSDLAGRLISLGALWNTMVMVFKIDTLLDLLRFSAPRFHASFQRISRALGTPYESSTIHTVYEDLKSLDFCKDLIRLCDLYSRNQFSVIRMRGVLWSDWGCAIRILADLEKLDYLNRIRSLSPTGSIASQFSLERAEMQIAASL
jgi:mannose-1-phosphate guanylyltransferase